jgi:hypothetical protein
VVVGVLCPVLVRVFPFVCVLSLARAHLAISLQCVHPWNQRGSQETGWGCQHLGGAILAGFAVCIGAGGGGVLVGFVECVSSW